MSNELKAGDLVKHVLTGTLMLIVCESFETYTEGPSSESKTRKVFWVRMQDMTLLKTYRCELRYYEE